MDITFELAKPEDAKEIYKIQQLAYKQQLDMYQDYDTNPGSEGVDWVLFRINNHIYYKIICDGKLIGQIDIYQHRRSAMRYEMNGICVHPDYQNQGIGRKAFEFVEKEYADAEVWSTWTYHRVDKNRHFCEKLGFERSGKEERITDTLTLVQYVKRAGTKQFEQE